MNYQIHRDYSSNSDGAYIYLKIFMDRIEVSNPGELYGNTRLESLGTDSKLEVRNSTIIRLLEEITNIVENRHTGIATMREEMKKANLLEPEFESLRGNFKVTFFKENKNEEKTTMKNDYEKILEFCKTPRNINEIMSYMELKHKPNFRKNYLIPLLNQNKLEMTIPEQPRNKNQKYIIKK